MKYLLVILLFITGAFSASSINIFPYNIAPEKQYPEGKIRKIQFENDEIYSYYIIPNWAGKNEFVYIENAEEEESVSGIRLNFDFIYDILKFKRDVLIVSKRNDSVFVSLATPDLVVISSEFINIKNDYRPVSIKYTQDNYIRIDNILIELDNENGFSLDIIDNKTADFNIYNSNLIFLSDNNGISSLKIRNDSVINTFHIFDSYEKQKLLTINNKILLLGSNSISSSTNCITFNYDKLSEKNTFWIESSINMIEVYKNKIYFINKSEDKYHIEQIDIDGSTEQSFDLPGSLYEPQLLNEENGEILAIFRNAILGISNLEIQYKIDYPIGENFNKKIESYKVNNTLILTSENYSQVFKISDNHLWRLKKYFSLLSDFLLPFLIVIIILGLFQLYRHQRRYVSEILELPSIGLVLIIDRNGRLSNMNDKAREILKIPYNLKGKKSIEYFFSNETYRPFLEMIQRSFKTRLDHYKRINIIESDTSKEWYCRTVILKNLTGQFRGLIFTSLDITEQLERKRLSNWASLAHDMQTNLSTIRLNAQQISINDNDDDNSKPKNKILHQVNILFNRVRDIVTVGRDNSIDKQSVNAAEVCIAARNEFDELMFPNISFKLNIENYIINCDKNKLIRALRNSIENGIKAIKQKNGEIIIATYKDKKTGYFSVKDDGIGMDDEVRKKMLNPYFTTGSKTGGSGIGTMIMLHVTEIHNGSLEINSKKGEGTEVIFKIPLGKTNE